MIVDDNIPDSFVSDDHSFPRKAVLRIIFQSIENTITHFIITVEPFIDSFNEDAFTQEFVEKNDFQLSKLTNSIGVKNQYKDIIYKTKGIPDIYYHFKEEEGIRKPIFIIEAKVLPAPSKDRNKEYVYGCFKKSGSPSGGIQRFRVEKQGKGQDQCGLLAYILEANSLNWHSRINNWIRELNINGSPEEEYLTYDNQKENYSKLTSKITKNTNEELTIHHFWIFIN